MKFKQLSTGAVLNVTNKSVIEMMQSSDAYAAMEQPKAKPAKTGKEKDPASSGKATA